MWNDKDQIVFALFLFPIHFTVFITAERRSCDTTPSQLALNGDSMVQFNLIDYMDSTGHADTKAWYTWYATQEVRFSDSRRVQQTVLLSEEMPFLKNIHKYKLGFYTLS